MSDTIAEILLWGRNVGAVTLAEGSPFASFEYAEDFLGSGIEVSPLMMPLARRAYVFPGLPHATFHGLPGLLADALPDKFGNSLINVWLASQGRPAGSLNAVERLCYTGTRGMGAMEFHPMLGPRPARADGIDIDALVRLASEVLGHRDALRGSFEKSEREKALRDILRVGTSAGGARAKAVIAWNPATNEVRSGQIEAGSGFEYWLLKFDGVDSNRDKELDDPSGYGAIEYAYFLMARDAGITMSDCRLLEENGRRHFMTRRFDRTTAGSKLHMASLGAMAHLDFNSPGAHSYEQALLVMRQLQMPPEQIEEQFRRMVFNIVARNQDDHVKNIAFLMDKAGRWQLSPAFDVTYSYNPQGAWTSTHQMSMNGKRDNFTREDFKECGRTALLPRGRAERILKKIQTAVAEWPTYAARAVVRPEYIAPIAKAHRMEIA